MKPADRLKQADTALNLCKIASRKPAPERYEYQARAIRAMAVLDRLDTKPLCKILGMDPVEFVASLRLARALQGSRVRYVTTLHLTPTQREIVRLHSNEVAA